ESNPDGASCLGPMAGLEKQREQYAHAVEALSDPERTRLVLVTRLHGVGKTTMAAAIAISLADKGFDVHLTTSDPAAHLSTTLNGSLKNLQVSRINPQDETERYRQHVLETKGRDLDEAGKRL
ncbi:ArsA-related P-loop ATPase, partial [Klebsiella pneumoniae]|uniref:ArsA-related P-loop ATPase n=1 Tax=Klebsiella pneumoniae TaxID=573 RepID=UPI0025B78F53